jgi:hypothetical protein
MVSMGVPGVKMVSIPKSLGDTEKWLIESVIPSLSRSITLDWGFWIQFQLALIDELPDEVARRVKGDE